MGAAAARSGAPCVPTATPGPWDIPPAIGDAWFIHYPIYTGCVAARLETRSAAQRAVRRPQNRSEDGRGDTRSGDSPAKGTRSPARTTGSTGGSRGGGPGRSARSKSTPASRASGQEPARRDRRRGRRGGRLLELDEDSGEEQDSETGQVGLRPIYGRHQNQWSHRRALLLPTEEVRGTPASLLRLSRASRRLCFKEGRYGSRSPSYAVAQRGAQRAVQDIVPYLRMLVVGDIRARSYATGQQSLGDETIDVGATL